MQYTIALHFQGLEAMFEDYVPHRYSMVSKGCIVIHIPRSTFKELVGGETLKVRAEERRYDIVVYCWTSVVDGGPTLNELLGSMSLAFHERSMLS